MRTEQTFIIETLADHINRRETEKPEVSLDWDTVLSYAHKHQVEGILYYQCKEFLPEEIRDRLSQLYASNLFYYTNRKKQLDEIEKVFAEKRISYYTVKGLNVAQFYPVPALRTMGDCDIIVHSEDKSKAHEVMTSLGYANHLKQDMEWTYFKNNLEFEIHDQLLYDEVVNSRLSKDFTDTAWEHARQVGTGSLYELDWNFHFIFLLLHLKKHFLNSGVGFRQFMDLVVVTQHQELDWQWLQDILDRLDLLEFAKVCCAFCERWFDVKMPLSATINEDFYERSTERIFENGIFGFDNPQNKENANLNSIREKGKVGTIVERVFPPYRNVRYVPHYAFVNGRPFLLPLVWIYRLIRSMLKGKGSDGLKLIISAVNSDDAMNSREAMLKQWGL